MERDELLTVIRAMLFVMLVFALIFSAGKTARAGMDAEAGA
jgi:hypothetical protein